MKTHTTLIISILCAFSSFGQSNMANLFIGENQRWVNELTLEVIAVDSDNETPSIKFLTDNENTLSITLKEDKIVFMENNWNQKPISKQSLFPGFIFGETTLEEIISPITLHSFPKYLRLFF